MCCDVAAVKIRVSSGNRDKLRELRRRADAACRPTGCAASRPEHHLGGKAGGGRMTIPMTIQWDMSQLVWPPPHDDETAAQFLFSKKSVNTRRCSQSLRAAP